MALSQSHPRRSFSITDCCTQVLAEDSPGREETISAHTAKYPNVCWTHFLVITNCYLWMVQEASPLRDTATTNFGKAYAPTNREFIPMGHVGLVLHPEEDASFGLPPSGVFWIHYLYISWAIQKSGIGRSAMMELERIAAQPPLNGELMVLDTITEEFQFSDFVIDRLYTSKGNPPPAVSSSSFGLVSEHGNRR